jgi:hypothetical protein
LSCHLSAQYLALSLTDVDHHVILQLIDVNHNINHPEERRQQLPHGWKAKREDDKGGIEEEIKHSREPVERVRKLALGALTITYKHC